MFSVSVFRSQSFQAPIPFIGGHLAIAKPKFFYGWYIVVCGFLSQGMRVGLGPQTFGFFFKPMAEELGLSRSLLTGGLIVRDLVGVVLGPAVGFAVDRFGPRFLMAGSAIMMGTSLMLLSQTHALWQFVLFFGVIGAFGVPGLGYGVLSPTLAKWFIRKRGRATGIATAGLNIGAVATTPLIIFLIEGFGWRTAWFCLAFVPWFVVVPPALIWLRRQPEDMGLLPDGDDIVQPQSEDSDDSRRASTADPDAYEVSWTAREAFRTPALWLLLVSEAFSGMSMGAIIVHRIPYITDQGFSVIDAGVTFVTYSISAFLSKLFWGFLADRFPIRSLATVALLGAAVGLFFMIDAQSVWQLHLGFGVIYGLTGGGLVVIGPLIWARYFGRRYQGAIRGLLSPFRLVSSIGGPMFAAFIFDTTGSYDIAFMFFVSYFVIGAFFIWLARPPVHPSRLNTLA